MWSNSVRTTAVGLCLLMLSGCGVFRDRSNDYRDATLSGELELPAGMHSDAMADRYVVPGIENHAKLEGEFVVPRPEGLAKNVGSAEVRIQKLGDKSWILSDGGPNEVWPRIRAFLDRTGLKLAKLDGDRGIMETEWRVPDANKPRERFRFVMEQGVQVGTSEVSVLVQTGADGEWPAASTDLNRESTMVRVLAQHLADSQAQATVSVLARRSGASKQSSRVALEGTGSKQYLRLKLDNDRAWAALGLALEKAGFEIEEYHRNVGKYWVSYLDPEDEETGWFAGLFGISNSRKTSRYVVEMQTVASDESVIVLNYRKGRRLKDEQREILLKRIMGYMH